MSCHRLIQHFVRRKACRPDKMQKTCVLSGQSAIYRTNSAEGLWTERLLQKAFSHMSNLGLWNLGLVEILRAKESDFQGNDPFRHFK